MNDQPEDAALTDPHHAQREEMLSRYETLSGAPRSDKDVQEVYAASGARIRKGIARLDALEALAKGSSNDEAIDLSGLKRAAFYNFKKKWTSRPSISAILPYNGRPGGALSTKPVNVRAQHLAAQLDDEHPASASGRLAQMVADETGVHPLVCLSYVRRAREKRTGQPSEIEQRYAYRTNRKAYSLAEAVERANPLLSLRQIARMVMERTDQDVCEDTCHSYVKRARERRTGKSITGTQSG